MVPAQANRAGQASSWEQHAPPCNGERFRTIDMARKLIGFDPETLQALELLSKDSGKSLQQLADEAFADLLTKHHRPRTFVEALKQSARPVPANENKPKKRGGS